MRDVDLTETEVAAIRSGQHSWGRWKYFPTHSPEAVACGVIAEEPTVGIHVGYGEYYDFELSRCATELAIGTWVVHLAAKDWANPTDIGDFLQMLLDLYEAQVFVLSCSNPEPKRCRAMWCLELPASGGYCKHHRALKAKTK